MKKRILVLIALLCLCIGIFLFSSCEEPTSAGNEGSPEKLTAPVLTLEGNVVTWQANENAEKFEISLDGVLSYVENTVTNNTMRNGQSIKIRAIGDGTKYATSDWSNTVLYAEAVAPMPPNDSNADQAPDATDPSAPPNIHPSDTGNDKPQDPPSDVQSRAPVYLGIEVSKDQPTASGIPGGMSLMSLASTFDLMDINTKQILSEYISNPENSLGAAYPTESNYKLYSAPGSVVYVQIWLDNPDQNTILSFKLNGTKYQSGGALSSFFVANGNSYLNCVYVAVTVPENAYNEISYKVTEIEYVEGTNINQDGKDVMIDTDNDTVVIGLPYENPMPNVYFSSSATTTASSVSFSVKVTDSANYLAVTGAWMRIVILDQSGSVLEQKALTAGENEVVFNDLSANTNYIITAFLYADIRDGNGVSVHPVYTAFERTPAALTLEAVGDNLLNTENGKYYANIKINASLSDPSFTFTRVEIYEGYNDSSAAPVYTGAFNGESNVTENIFSGKDYCVKVYYQNAIGVEQFATAFTFINNLETPWVTQEYTYGLLKDGIIGFRFSTDYKCNMDALTLRVFDEYSKEYIAKDALEIINNPNVIDELEAKLSTLDRFENNEEFNQVYRKLDTLRRVRETMEKYHTAVTKTEWETLAEGSIYLYEITFGDNTEFFVGPDGMYYIVLKDFQNKRVSEYSLQFVLCADIDFNNGEPIEEKTLCGGWFDILPAIGESDYLFSEQFCIKDNNKVYLETKSRNNLGNESYRMLGYVNQIVLADGYNILEVLWTQETPPNDIDEAAWLEDVIEALKNGEEAESVFPLGDMSPIEFDLNVNTDIVGEYDIRFTYKMFGKTYTEEEPYDWAGETVTYYVIGKLPTASISINTEPREDYGVWEIRMPEDFGWFWLDVEVKNESGVTIGTYDQNNYYEIGQLKANYSIRVRLMDKDDNPYYLDGDWSEWFICTPAKYNAPNLSYAYFSQTEVNVDWEWEYDRRYGYTVNGGSETVLTDWQQITAKTGDIVRVRVIAPDGSGFESSDYAELKITDNRKKLKTPEVTLQYEDSIVYIILPFDNREENVGYFIYDSEGNYKARFNGNSDRTGIKSQYTGTYKVVAVSRNHAEYSDSDPYVFTI